MAPPGNIPYLYVMQRLTTLLLLVGITFTTRAQTVDDYQPDANGDGCVGMSDLLSLLSVFGSCEAQAFACGDPVSYQGYDYATVLIGEQCWFAENLRSELYLNGDSIPTGLNDDDWFFTYLTELGATEVPGGNASNLETYGRLYNWFAVGDARGLCPNGWHVPTDEEWGVMINLLGGTTAAGVQMKTTYGWTNGGNGTNSSGFSGLPANSRDGDGEFWPPGGRAYFWSSSSTGIYGYYRPLWNYSDWTAQNQISSKRSGFSVRCIQGSE